MIRSNNPQGSAVSATLLERPGPVAIHIYNSQFEGIILVNRRGNLFSEHISLLVLYSHPRLTQMKVCRQGLGGTVVQTW
jgi:hypothetical protein